MVFQAHFFDQEITIIISVKFKRSIMKRAELVKKLSLLMNVTRKEADLYIVAFLGSIMENLYVDERVVFNGFGTFKIKKHKAWIARNQITGELMQIPVRHKISFHPGKELRERVNTI